MLVVAFRQIIRMTDIERPIPTLDYVNSKLPASRRRQGGAFDAVSHPGLGERLGMLVRNRLEQALEEKVVDVNADIVVVERQKRRSWKLEAIVRRVLVDGIVLRLCERIQEHRPALLQERKECLRVRNDGFQRPALEQAVLMKHLDKALIEDGRNSLSAVMAAQQDPEQVRWLLDEFRRDLEHMTKDELLRSVVAELPRRVPQLRIEQGVEISPVERRDHGIAEIREEIAQVERELAASLQQVVGQGIEIV